MPKFWIIIPWFFTILILYSCHKEKFNSERWKAYGDKDGPDGSERLAMAEDLLESHKLLRINKKQLLELLATPENDYDSTSTWYTLTKNYDMIDPVSGKYLTIYFDKDSLARKASIIAWYKH